MDRVMMWVVRRGAFALLAIVVAWLGSRGCGGGDSSGVAAQSAAKAKLGWRLQLEWQGGQDLEFAVSDDQGVFVTRVDTGSNPESCTIPALGAGDRLIRVGSRSSTTTNYVLTIGPR